MTCAGTAWVIVRYADGTEVHAHPNHTSEDVARAVALGYPDVDAMTMAHDPTHEHLARALGFPHSPTLWAVAHGTPIDPQAEEAMVLAAQRFVQVAGR